MGLDTSQWDDPHGGTAISLFAGCGGSSLGYRMAGWDVRLANEFVSLAADTYEANSPAIVDRRDIRELTGADLLRQVGIKRGELDLLDGSPPCASFTNVHRGGSQNSKRWGKVVPYSGREQRVDDLFWEYARIRDEMQPRLFVAENVPGLAAGRSLGYFDAILARLSEGYRVTARYIDAARVEGSPTIRKRLFFIGVRDDLPGDPPLPKPTRTTLTVEKVLREVGARYGYDYRTIRLAVRRYGTPNRYRPVATNQPAPTITASGIAEVFNTACGVIDVPNGFTICPSSGKDLRADSTSFPRHNRPNGRLLAIPEVAALQGFPPDFQFTGTWDQQWERIGRSVPPPLSRAIGRAAAEWRRTHV